MRPSRNEAAVYQRRHGHRDIVIERSGWGLLDPFNAQFLDARRFASLAGAREGVRFDPDTLATPNGMLRLSEISMTAGLLPMKARDDRAMSMMIAMRFALQRDPISLARLVSMEIIRTMARELPARVISAVRAEISRLNYDALQAERREIETRVLKLLRATICGRPGDGSERLGIVLSSLSIDFFEDGACDPEGGAPPNLASFITQTASAMKAVNGGVDMNDIMALAAGRYSLEQTRVLAKAPNGFMIAPQHLGGFDPNAGAYSPMMNPAIAYLNRAHDREPAAPPPDGAGKGDAPRLEAQTVSMERPVRSVAGRAQKPPPKGNGRDFDSDWQRFSGPL